MNDKPYDENELVRLCGLLVDEQLNEADTQILADLLTSDSNARTFFRSYMETHARLLLHYEPLSVVGENAEEPLVRVAARHDKSQRLRPMSNRHWLALIAAAASLLLALGLWRLWPSGEPRPIIAGGALPRRNGPIEPPQVQVVGLWQITPTGDADFQVIEPRLVRLNRGELLVESLAEAPAPISGEEERLRIKTPHGEAVAEGTRFYIGTHAATPIPDSKGTPSMKTLTRVLVLAGAVTFTNMLGSVTGNANELLAAEPDARPVALAVEASSNFAIDYYKHQAKTSTGENIFFSPYSISTCLMMVQEGARGQTAEQMGKVLGYPDVTRRIGEDAQQIPWQTSLIQSGLAQIDARLNQVVDKDKQARLKKEIDEKYDKSNALYRLSRDLDDEGKHAQAKEVEKEAYRLNSEVFELKKKLDPTHLVTANAIWVDNACKLSAVYVKTLTQHFKTGGAFETNFQSDADTERKRINAWVAQRTQGLIADLLSEGSVSDQTRAVLTNTIYFNAHWVEKFNERDTNNRDFHLADGKTVSVPMMQQDHAAWCRFGAFTKDGRPAPTGQNMLPEPGADGFRVLEMPYKNGTASMLLIAPEKPANLGAIESILTPQAILAWAKQIKQTELSILMIPKFKMRTGYQLKDQLSTMGMPLAFDGKQANFTGMQASPSQDPLFIDQVYHQAFLEVNETGTVAGAATAVVAANADVPGVVRPEFRADRPFLFMIRDNQTGTILFMGRMMDPTAK